MTGSAKQSTHPLAASWIASSLSLLAMTISSQLRRRPRQQLPVRALLLPVHQDAEIGRALLAVGHALGFTEPMVAPDRGRPDHADLDVLPFQRQPFGFSVGGVGDERRLVLDP